MSLPTKQTQSETASIFPKSQLDLPPGGEAACLCASHIRVVNFLPAVGGECNPRGLRGRPTCRHDKGKSWSPPEYARNPNPRKQPLSHLPGTNVNLEEHALGIVHFYMSATSWVWAGWEHMFVGWWIFEMSS